MSINEIKSEKYINHSIFQELEHYITYYDRLSFSILQWLNMGIRGGIFNYESYLLSSVKGTIESIKTLLINGRLNDAYSLTRKYHDSVIINIYADLYLEDNFSIENMVVQQINNWLHGKEKLPTYKIMNNYLSNHQKLQSINKLLLHEHHYSHLRQRLNDHTHYNFFQYMMFNDNEIYNPKRIETLGQMSNDIRDIFIKHFIWLFTIKDHYMMSSDYRDYLDCGETPPEGSQYDVANFIQEVFENIIKIYREDLAIELKNSTCMNLL